MIKKYLPRIIAALTACLLTAALFGCLIYSLRQLYPSDLPRLPLKPVENSEKVPDYSIVYATVNNDIELRTKSRIKKIGASVIQFAVPSDFTLEVKNGQAVKQDEIIAAKEVENKTAPCDGRVTSIEKPENGDYTLVIEPFSNYAVNLILQPEEYEIFENLKAKKSDAVEITVNGYMSAAFVDAAEMNATEGVYEITLQNLTYNPYIFPEYEVNLYRLVESLEPYLLFPKSCYHTVSATNYVLNVKRIYLNEDGSMSSMKDVSLKYVPEFYSEIYYCVLNPTLNKGYYLVA